MPIAKGEPWGEPSALPADGVEASHLSHFMAESDPYLAGGQVPRFVSFSDNRDFIYLLRKE